MRPQYRKRAINSFVKQAWALGPQVLIDGVDQRELNAAKAWELIRRTPLYKSIYNECVEPQKSPRIRLNLEFPPIFSGGVWKTPSTEAELRRARRDADLGPIYELIASGCNPQVNWKLLDSQQKAKVEAERIWPKLGEPSEAVSLGICEVVRQRNGSEIITGRSHGFIHLPNEPLLPADSHVSRFVVIRFDPFESEPELVRQVEKKLLLLHSKEHKDGQETFGAAPDVFAGYLQWRCEKGSEDLKAAARGPFPSNCRTVLCFFSVNGATTIIKWVRSALKNRQRWIQELTPALGLLHSESDEYLEEFRTNPVSMPDFWWALAAFDAKKKGILRKGNPVGDFLFQSQPEESCEWFHKKAAYMEEIIQCINGFWRSQQIRN